MRKPERMIAIRADEENDRDINREFAGEPGVLAQA